MERHTPDRPHNKPLKRGKACLTCRFLKIKCDGERPVCGPCLRHPKDDPCEYADGPGRSRTRLLEETIARLEARIRELENPDMSTPPVTLHDPYNPQKQSLHLSTPVTSPETLGYSPSSPFSATSTLSTRSSPPSGENLYSGMPAPSRPAGAHGFAGSTSSSSISPLADMQLLPPESIDEPSPATMRNLLDRFFIHASEFGFFLDVSRIYNGAFIPQSYIGAAGLNRPSQGLLRTIYLWGAHLSPSSYPPEHEHEYMLRALSETAVDLASSENTQKFLQTIQAEVLLAYYFYRIGRCLEAKLHAHSAASLTLGAGLHRLRSRTEFGNNSAPIAFLSNGPIYLPEPRDPVEEGERINGFWAVLMLCKNINVAFADAPGTVCGIFETPGLRIDTPWPLDMDSYHEGYLPPPNNNTIHNFLSGVKPEYEDYESSILTKTVKASILFHRATYLSGQFSPHLQPNQMQTFNSAFSYLDHIIEALYSLLPPLEELNAGRPLASKARIGCLAHASTYAASIKLHEIFAYSYSAYSERVEISRQKCLSSARNMLKVGDVLINTLNGKDFGCVNPIMGTLWVTTCHVFISELNRVRSVHSQDTWPLSPASPPSPISPLQVEDELVSSIHQCLTILSYFATESLIIRYQLTKLQEVCSSIGFSPS